MIVSESTPLKPVQVTDVGTVFTKPFGAVIGKRISNADAKATGLHSRRIGVFETSIVPVFYS